MLDTLREFLTANESAMLKLLEEVVVINSWTGNKPGVDQVADVFEREVREMGYTVHREAQTETGDNVAAANPARLEGGGGVLMVGHMDTVFPPEMGFNDYRQEGNLVFGPGVNDMKSGIVVGIFAAKALAAAGMAHIPVGFVFNADEETGSPHSRPLIQAEARKSDFCFVMESDGGGGEVVTGRKGRIVFDVTAAGQAAHAGHCPLPHPSAIVCLAHAVTALEKLNDLDPGTTVNIGVIEGGVGPNTIAAQATARVETRFTSLANRERVRAAIDAIMTDPKVEGTTLSTAVVIERPPMEPCPANNALFDTVHAAAKELGQEVRPVFRAGGSDANVISQAGVPVLDGLGPSGGKLHTLDEYLEADTMVDAALLTALSIVRAYEQKQAAV